MFLVGKIIVGIATGMIKVTALTYISENAPTSLRGPAMSLFPAFTILGQLCGAAVVFGIEKNPTAWGYLPALASQWIIAIPPLVISYILPESPAFLVRKHKLSEALDCTKRLLGPDAPAESHLGALQLNIEAEEQLSREVAYKTCFSKLHRRRTAIVMFANTLPALFGQQLLTASGYFNQVTGMDSTNSLRIKIVGICLGLVATACGIWTISKVARRKLTNSTLVVIAILWTGMGVSGFWTGQVTAWYTAGTMMAVTVVSGLGCWATGYAIMGETSSLRMRAKTQAVGNVTQQAASVVMSYSLPYIFNPDAGNLRSKTGFVFTGLSLIAAVITWLYVPEMKGRSVGEIDAMFALGLSAKEFKNWKPESRTKTEQETTVERMA
jgi:MFS transporter, SP family, general alpha glucoside:H+ symporter